MAEFNLKQFLDGKGLETVLHAVNEKIDGNYASLVNQLTQMAESSEFDGSSIFISKTVNLQDDIYFDVGSINTYGKGLKPGDFIISVPSVTMHIVTNVSNDGKFMTTFLFSLKPADGKDGVDGEDGVGVADFDITSDGELIIHTTDGVAHKLGKIVGERGPQGLSAYEVAHDNGYFDGDVTSWLKSLKGDSIINATMDEKGQLILQFETVDDNGESHKDKTVTVGRVLGQKGTSVTDAFIDAQGFIHLQLTSYDLENNETTQDFVISKNVVGKDGLTPELQVNTNKESSNYGNWEVSYDGGRNWIPLNHHAVAPPAKFWFGEKGTDSQYVLHMEQFDSNSKATLGVTTRDLKGKSAYEVAKDNGFIGNYDEWHESLRGPQGDKGDKGDTGSGLSARFHSADGRAITLLQRLKACDLNNDGKVDSEDVRLIRKYLGGGIGPDDQFDVNLADIDGDGEVTENDARLLGYYVLNGTVDPRGFEGKIADPNSYLTVTEIETGNNYTQNLRGPMGPQGIQGQQGAGFVSARIGTSIEHEEKDRLILNLKSYNPDGSLVDEKGTDINVGIVVGKGVQSVQIADNGDLSVTTTKPGTDGTDTAIIGNIKCIKDVETSKDDKSELVKVDISYNTGEKTVIEIPYGVTPEFAISTVAESDEFGNDNGVLYGNWAVHYGELNENNEKVWHDLGYRAIGKSAYELALESGYEGTLDEWVASLKGEKGDQGIQGIQGEQGISGVYTGPGEMPDGYNVQVDPSGSATMGVYVERGVVASPDDLPMENNSFGDIYLVSLWNPIYKNNKYRYIWTGSKWEILGNELAVDSLMGSPYESVRPVTGSAVRQYVTDSLSSFDEIILNDTVRGPMGKQTKYRLYVENGELKLQEVTE